MADETPAPPAKPKKKGGFLKILIAVVVLLGVAGGGAAFFLKGGDTAKAEEEPGLEERGLVTFETFLVNLADAGGNRFLKVNLQIVLESEEEAAKVQETPVVMSALRSALIELLTQQQASVLVTADGKTALKKEIKERVAGSLKHRKVIDVLFSEFVVQF
jgi:flagellar protein FliL